jgi:hypothetical protein
MIQVESIEKKGSRGLIGRNSKITFAHLYNPKNYDQPAYIKDVRLFF